MKLVQIENKKDKKLLFLDTHPSNSRKGINSSKEIIKIVCFLGTISKSKV